MALEVAGSIPVSHPMINYAKVWKRSGMDEESALKAPAPKGSRVRFPMLPLDPFKWFMIAVGILGFCFMMYKTRNDNAFRKSPQYHEWKKDCLEGGGSIYPYGTSDICVYPKSENNISLR